MGLVIPFLLILGTSPCDVLLTTDDIAEVCSTQTESVAGRVLDRRRQCARTYEDEYGMHVGFHLYKRRSPKEAQADDDAVMEKAETKKVKRVGDRAVSYKDNRMNTLYVRVRKWTFLLTAMELDFTKTVCTKDQLEGLAKIVEERLDPEWQKARKEEIQRKKREEKPTPHPWPENE